MLELTERHTHGPSNGESHDVLCLPYADRIKGRLRTRTEGGREAGLFIERGQVLNDGDWLRARTGEWIQVRAADEPVVTARIGTGLPLARLAYHLGNRHVTLEVGEDGSGSWIRFQPDHVLEDLAIRLGASLRHHQAPFNPEPGAYQGQGRHGAGHAHHHSHEHDRHDPIH
ncbi:MAG: urease accessory protein UreE [Gammaproteobacteria bacterium]|nr:MAG: urease accessory protein UreE [Gammaproteobacteria bacterium]